MMEKLRKISTKYYLRQIITYWLACWMFFGLPAQVAMAATPVYTDAGTATITQNGNTSVLANQAQTIIEWSNFNTIDDELVAFTQLSTLSNSAVLNNVSGSQTQFNGDLTGAGMRIFIVNSSGIVFGSTATVNVAQLVASGLNMTNPDFLNFTDETIDKMKFQGGTGTVTNDGIINATDSAYLVGRQVFNTGTITSPIVVLAAGDKVFLKHSGSNVFVELTADLGTTVPANNTVNNSGTITATGQVLLAAGDIFSTAISGVDSLAAVANKDITLGNIQAGEITLTADNDGVDGGNVFANGTLTSTTGNIEISASDSTIHISEDVTAEVDLLLNNDTEVAAGKTLEAGNDVVLAGGKTLDGDGTLTVIADDDIILGAGSNPGDVTADGILTLDAGHSVEVADGGSITASDDVEILGQLKALGDLTIEATTGGIDVEAVSMDVDDSLLSLTQNNSLHMENALQHVSNSEDTDLFAKSDAGSVTSSKADTWKSIEAEAYTDIILNDSDTGGDIRTKALTADTKDIVVISDLGKVIATENIEATLGDVSLTADEGIDVTKNITAGGGGDFGGIILDGTVTAVGTDDQKFDAEAGTLWAKDTPGRIATITKTGAGKLTLAADTLVDLDGVDGTSGDSVHVQAGALTIDGPVDAEGNLRAYGVIHITGPADLAGHVYSTGSGITFDDDVTADGDGDQEFDAGTGVSDVLDAAGNIIKTTTGTLTIVAGGGVDLTGDASQRIDAELGKLWVKNPITKTSSGAGNLTLGGLEVSPETVGIDLDGTVDVQTTGGSLTIEDNFRAAGNLTASENVTFDGSTVNGTLDGAGSQRIDAEGGALWANGWLHKTATGDLTLAGETGIDLDGYVDVDDGSLYIEDDFSAAGNLTASVDVEFDGSTVNGTLDGAGSQRIDAEGGALWANGWLHKTTTGDLTLAGDMGINLDGTVSVETTTGGALLDAGGNGSLIIEDSFTAAADLLAQGSVYFTDATKTNVVNATLDGGVTQAIRAENGAVYANGWILKPITAPGNLDMFGAYEAGGSNPWGYSVETKEVRVLNGELTIKGNGYVYLGGDIYSSGNMWLSANQDQAGYTGYLYHGGSGYTIESPTGNVDMSATNFNIYLKSGPDMPATYVSAGGDILLHDDTWVAIGRKLDAGQDVIVGDGTADGTTLTGQGALTIEANRHITLGGAVVASDVTSGDLILMADADTDNVGHMTAYGTITNTANGGGSIDIYSSDTTTYLWGNVTAAGDIILHNSTKLVGARTLHADDDVVLAAGKFLSYHGAGGTITLEAGDDIILGITNTADTEGSQATGSAGNVTSNADLILTAGDDIYAHGWLKTFNGGDIDITSADDTTFLWNDVMASGDVILNNNTVVKASGKKLDAGDDVILAGGKTLESDYDLTINAGDDILLGVDPGNHEDDPWSGTAADVETVDYLVLDAEDHIFAYGTLTSTSGSIDLYSSDASTFLWDDVTAYGDLYMHNTTIVYAPGKTLKSTHDDVILVAGKSLSSSDDLTINAYDDIILGAVNPDNPLASGVPSHVLTNNGDLTLIADDADNQGSSGGDIIGYGHLTSFNGTIEARASDDIYLFQSVIALDGSIILTADSDNGNWYNSGDLVVKGNLEAGVDIELSASARTIILGGDYIKATGNVLLNDDTELDGSGGQRIEATTGTLTAERDIDKTTSGNLNLAGGSGIILGDDVSTEDGDLIFENAVEAVGTGWSRRNQTFDADGDGAQLIAEGNIEKTTSGNLTLGGGYDAVTGYEIDLQGNVTVLGGDLIVGDHWRNDDTTVDPDKTLEASDDVKVYGFLNGEGNLTIEASDNTIYLWDDVYVEGDLLLGANTKFKGWEDQYVDAGGMITADGWLDKSPGLFSHSDGSLYLHADGDISLDDYVRAARFSLFGKYKGGGVSIISDSGRIFTPDGSGTLNIDITGRSDHFAGIGVDLPFGEDLGKAAIVIQSSDDLLLGPKANLIARGKYYDDGVDDRPGVDFLDVPDTHIPLGGPLRDEGDPFDVAIYVGSTAGNVDIGAEVTIKSSEWVPDRCWGHYEFVPKGAMVADAYNTVTFDGGVPGGLFEQSLADGDVGDRLEVVSRITEWLYQAYNNGRLPYVYGGGPFPLDYTYVLRGAGLGNGITDSRAWVLEDPTPAAPLYEEAGEGAERLTLGLEGCPVLVAAVSAELGIPGDTIEVSLANSFALNTDIQPCESCARLLNAATILRDEDGSRMAALNQVFNTVAPAGAPYTPEMQALIVTAFAGRVNDSTQYATAIEYMDAFVRYIAVLGTEMGSPVADGDSLAFVMGKYGAGVLGSDNSNIAAFVATRLESGETFGE